MDNKKKKREFSKVVFAIVMFLFTITIAFSMYLMYITMNTDALAYLIPSVSGLAATSVGFYYNKAKAENRLKLAKEYDKTQEEVKEIQDEVTFEDNTNV